MEENYYKRVKLAIIYSDSYKNLSLKLDSLNKYTIQSDITLIQSMCKEMAHELNLNEERVEVLSLLKGIISVPFENEGMEYLKRIAQKNNYTIKENEICKYFAKKILKENNLKIEDEILETIDEIYNMETKNIEAKVIINIYKMFEDINLLKKQNSKLEKKLNKEVIEILYNSIDESKKENEVKYSTILSEIWNKYNVDIKEKLDDSQKEILENLWKKYSENSNSKDEIIYKIIEYR